MHKADMETLKEQFGRLDPNKAPGIDKKAKEAYGERLNENLSKLLESMKKLNCRPQPVRRTCIPKDGSDAMRPLGIPALEDKIVQGAMAEVLSGICEPLFYDFSYGFRRGKSQRQAMAASAKS
jgi:retron-type reverse transcriptase